MDGEADLDQGLIDRLARAIEQQVFGLGFFADHTGKTDPTAAAKVGDIVRRAATQAIAHIADEIADGTAHIPRSQFWLAARDVSRSWTDEPLPVVGEEAEFEKGIGKLRAVPWHEARRAAEYLAATYPVLKQKTATHYDPTPWNVLRELTYAAFSLETALNHLKRVRPFPGSQQMAASNPWKMTGKAMDAKDRAAFYAEPLFLVLERLRGKEPTNPNILLGPVVWQEQGDKRRWYFMIVCGADLEPQMIETGGDEEQMIVAFRNGMYRALIEEHDSGVIIHDFADELEMARCAEIIWPVAKTRDIRAAIAAEREAWAKEGADR